MIGRAVAHYEIVEEIGGGGMGVVYKARDTRLDRLVALKFLPGEWSRDSVARERFAQEARAASAIEHPNICTVYDVGESDEGRMFIAMAYCPGQSLKQRISNGPLPVDQALHLACQAAEALVAAHEAGIVHRDIKPANILLDGRNQVKLVDFGLAKLAGGDGVTRAGTVVGTPAYMSPEQAEGRKVDHRTDIWSLGAVLYEMLSGLRPFKGDSDQAVMYSVVHHQPPPLSEARDGIIDGLLDVVERCLEKDPEKRYPTASALLADLRTLRGDSTPPEGPTLTIRSISRVEPRVRRWATTLAVTASVVVVVAVLIRVFSAGAGGLLPAEKTLVVLPFAAMGPEPAAAALCDGLVEQVTRTLSGMRRFRRSLTVVPSKLVRSERVADAGDAFVAYGATLAVNGTVEAEDEGGFEIVLELVDTRTGRVVRSRTVPWVAGRGSTLQDTLVDALAEMLELELDEPTRTAIAIGGTTDREAQALYTRAIGELGSIRDVVKIDRSIDLLRRALEFDPRFTLARVALADACRRRFNLSGDERWLDAAMTYSRQAVEDELRLPFAHVVKGRVLARAGMISEGLAAIDRAIELDPLNVEALRARAEIFHEQGDDETARTSFDTAIELDPDDWLAIEAAGVFYYDMLELETAIEYFRRVTELRPEMAHAWSNLGGALMWAGRMDEARTAMGRSVAIGPTYQGYSNLGTLEFYLGRFAAAVPLFDNALAINDSDWRAWNNLAESLRFGNGDPARSVEAFERAAALAEAELESDPGNTELRLTVASAVAAAGDTRRAREITDAVVAGGIDDPVLMSVVAGIEEELGDRTRALEWIERALRAGYPLMGIEDYPLFDELRQDPAYREIRARFGGPAPADVTTSG